MTVSEILSRSSNVGAITLAERLTRHRLVHWISRFGFGHLTGIDFPGESAGIVLPRTSGRAPRSGTSRSARESRSRRSRWPRPTRRSRTAASGCGRTWSTTSATATRPSPSGRRVVSGWVAREVMAMLKNVVAEGTGTLAAVPGYQVAGKTGTRSQAGRARRLLRLALRGLVRRRRAGLAAAAGDPRLGGRAPGRDLGRRRGRAGVRADREVRPSVPRRRRAPGRARRP